MKDQSRVDDKLSFLPVMRMRSVLSRRLRHPGCLLVFVFISC